MYARSGAGRLPSHLEATYGIGAQQVSGLDLEVFRVDRDDGPSWVARLFPAGRPAEAAAGDAGILRFLADRDFPAERCAASVVARDGGAWHHLTEVAPRAEIAAAARLLADAGALVPAGEQAAYESLREQIGRFDGCDGLPQTLIHPDFVLANVIASPDRGRVLVDWAGAIATRARDAFRNGAL